MGPGCKRRSAVPVPPVDSLMRDRPFLPWEPPVLAGEHNLAYISIVWLAKQRGRVITIAKGLFLVRGAKLDFGFIERNR